MLLHLFNFVEAEEHFEQAVHILGCHLVDTVLPMVRGGFVAANPVLGVTSGSSTLRFEGTDVLIRTSAYMPGGVLCRRLRVDGTKGTIDLCPIERFDGKSLTVQSCAARSQMIKTTTGI